MTLKAAEDFENIAHRLKELEADRQLALTGSSAPVKPKSVGDYSINYAYGIGADYDPA